MNRKQTAPQMTFAQTQDHLRQLCEGEGIPGWGPVHQEKPLDRFGKIRDDFEELRDQLESDPDYISFMNAIQKVLDKKARGKRSPLSGPKFRKRLSQLYNDCKVQRKRILALYGGLEASLHQLRKYLLNPEEEPRRRQAIDEALQSWYIAQDLFDPFNSYDEIVKESPSDYFGDPTGDSLQTEVREIFGDENLKGWGTGGVVPDEGQLMFDLGEEYERLQRNSTFLISNNYWRLLVWKVYELLNSPPGTQPDEEFQILVRQDLRQIQTIYEEIQRQWTDFLRMAEALAPLLSQKESTPERDGALKLVHDMYHLFKETCKPVDYIAERWPQLLPPEVITGVGSPGANALGASSSAEGPELIEEIIQPIGDFMRLSTDQRGADSSVNINTGDMPSIEDAQTPVAGAPGVGAPDAIPLLGADPLGIVPFGAGPSAEGPELSVQSEVETESSPNFEPKETNQNQPEPQSSFVEAQNYLKSLVEGAIIQGCAPSRQDQIDRMLERLEKIRYAFHFLFEIRGDQDYARFAREIGQVYHQDVLPSNDRELTKRLIRLYNSCSDKRYRIADLFRVLKDTIRQLWAYLSIPVYEERRDRAIYLILDCFEVRDVLLQPFIQYDDFFKKCSSKTRSDLLKAKVRQVFRELNLKGWGTKRAVPSNAAQLVRDLGEEYKRLRKSARIMQNNEYYREVCWKVQDLLYSPPGTQPDQEFDVLFNQKLSQIAPVHDKMDKHFKKFIKLTKALAPLLSQKKRSPEQLRALRLVRDMWLILRECDAPLLTIQEKWPQLKKKDEIVAPVNTIEEKGPQLLPPEVITID